jgi:hypothetical protein
MRAIILLALLMATATRAGSLSESTDSDALPGPSKQPVLAYTQTLANATTTLLRQFDDLLKDPAGYDLKAVRECGMFPEGRLYPFAIPALGYANLAISGRADKEYCLGQMRKLIDLMVPHVARDVAAPDRRLTNLRSYGKQGTRLSTLNLVLTCYALLSDDGRYADIHTAVSQVLYDALVEAKGGPIASYPEYTWYFDTIMTIASLWYHPNPLFSETSRNSLRQHLAWREQHAIHDPTGLPHAFEGESPRGCDLSMQICLLAQMDYSYAKRMYKLFLRSYWIDLGFAAGFSERPRGTVSSFFGDADSGPIVFGIGTTATGIGIGAATAMHDEQRLQRMAAELSLVPTAIAMSTKTGLSSPPLVWFKGFRHFSDKYFTGFLYGDCMMLYALTWTPYSKPAQIHPPEQEPVY